jgi:uncharacterized protein DUF5667
LNEYTPELDDILAQCLDAILQGKRTVRQCLERYPDAADDLKPMLEAAVLTERLKSPQMSAERVDLLEARLRAEMTKSRRSGSRILPFISSPLARAAAVIVIVFLLAIGGSAGAVKASADTVPGDFLYGFKRFWESVLLIFTPLTGQEDDLWLHFAQSRLDEALRLQAEGRLTDQALKDLGDTALRAMALADDQTRPQLTIFFDNAYKQLAAIPPPAGAQSAYEHALQILSESPPPVTATAVPTVGPTDTPTPTPPPPSATLIPTPTPTVHMRATQQSAYMTQTAGAPATQEP